MIILYQGWAGWQQFNSACQNTVENRVFEDDEKLSNMEKYPG
jgi:hypothetical protein